MSNNLLNKIKQNVTDPTNNTNIITKPAPDSLRYFSVDKFKTVLIHKLEQDYKNNKQRDYLRASEVGECANKLILRLLNTPVNFKMVSRGYYLPLMAHVGNAIHNFIQSHGDFSRIEYSVNSTRFKLHCRVDALIDDNVIVEIKSVGDAKVVREKDIYQVVANYLALQENGFNIGGGQLIYVSRTLTQYETYEIPLNELEQKSKILIDKIFHIFDKVQKGEETDNFLNKQECAYCEYNNICKNKKKGEKK